MKILVMSDSHSSLRLMRFSVKVLKPDILIHLGDYFDDGQVISEENPQIPFYQVPGNCDSWRCLPTTPDILCTDIDGVRMYLTHGHRHGVKLDTGRLIMAARTANADAVLYGHTHISDCHREDDGLWVLNPGTCGYDGGTVGLIETDNHKIINCRILHRADMEAIK